MHSPSHRPHPGAPASAALDDLGDFTTTPHVLMLTMLAIGIGVISSFLAVGLLRLIAFFTNLFFFQRISFAPASPAMHTLGAFVIAIPVIGGLIIGVMARYGSEKIRGHGIPGAIESILKNGVPVRAML